ncbi:MAG: GNAT family N-acetyltransferase [Candidatus Competibacterales bacterium]|nr:GNAT family N-acetyltransferase [Candidatus Competibacterales bacterium]
MQTSIVTSLDDIPATDWDALVTDGYPFLQHAFLAGLERHGCLGERSGWHPMHLLCHDAGGRLLGAVPMYLKENSFGEFVFDWSWADAYRRHGLDYYPKLVAAIPFTPATGTRLLLTGSAGAEAVAARLIEAARALAIDHGCSSLHWLFTTPADQSRLQAGGFLTRLGCQFHWHNAGYADFEQFLAALTAKKRKNIRRERRQVEDAGLRIRVVHGDQASESEWRLFHRLYRDTFGKYGNFPALTLGFFRHVGAALGRRVVMMIAESDGIDVAVALD